MMKRFLLLINLLIIFIPCIYANEGDFMSLDDEHIVLQKRAGMTFANQITKSNSTYEIRDIFDLNGTTITLPESCTLIFAGGALKNGTLEGNNTYMVGPAELILDETIHFKDADQFHIKGVSFPKGKDISKMAQKMLDDFNVLKLESGTYYLSSPLIVKNHYAVVKGEGKGTVLTTDRVMDFAIRTAFCKEVKTPGTYYNASFIEISDLKIDGTASKFFKNGIFLDGPSCTVSNCFVTCAKSVGIKLSEWCNNMFNCIVTHCDIGALITLRANGVNICFNRIESNNVNIAVQSYRGINISNNTLEGGRYFNIVLGSGQSCKIKDNYFEGSSNSIIEMLTTTENRSLEFTGKREIKGFVWLGNISLTEKDFITKISYKIGSPYAPSSVDIQDNYVDIHRDDDPLKAEPDVYFVLIGSCLNNSLIQKNIFSHQQDAVCGFFDTDNAVIENADVLNNYVTGTAQKVNSMDAIWDKHSKSGWRSKNHYVGEIRLDKTNK